MKVLLESSPLLGASGGRGIGTYTQELLMALRGLDQVTYPLLVQATHELGGKVEEPEKQFDLIHYPYFDLFFHTLPKRHQLPCVVTIHDVIPLLYPKNYPPGIKGSWRFHQQKRALENVQMVITDSEASKQDIQEHLGFPQDRVKSIYLAGSSSITSVRESAVEKAREQLSLPDKYIVYVGDINYNKNLPMLLVVLTQLPQSVHLCVVSQAFRNTDIPEGRELARAISENEIVERVHVLDIPKGDSSLLSAVLKGSICLVQPSLYEGFGLPVLEAMQAGTLVVSTDGGSLPEVAGTAAFLCEPKIASMTAALEEALQLSEEERKERIKAGFRNANRFSWENTASQTYQVYKEALELWKESA